MPRPKVSFVTVNYNQPAVTLELLESLRNLEYDNWEAIVVDNGSDQTLSAEVLAKMPGVKYIQMESNLGFAGGNNQGTLEAKGDFIFYINNDAEVSAGLLQPMLDIFESNPQVGIVSPKIRFFDSDLIQYAGFVPVHPITARNGAIGSMEEDTGKYDRVYATAYGHGAAMMLSRKVIDEVGLMDESYFLYYEELDWSERIRQKGYKIYYCGLSTVFHKASVSTGANSSLKDYYLTRNRMLFIRKNFKGLHKLLPFLYLLLVVSPKTYLKWLKRGQLGRSNPMVRAIIWHLR